MSMNHAPIEEVLAGVEIMPLDEGSVAVDVITIVKCLDPEGNVRWVIRSTEGLDMVATIGAVDVMGDYLRAQFLQGWQL